MPDDLSLREIRGEVSVEWKIKEFFSLPKENGYQLTSPTFRLSDAIWNIRIYPNGDDINSIGCISLYIHRYSSSSSKNCVAFTCGIRSCDGSDYLSRDLKYEFQGNKGYGWSDFAVVPHLRKTKGNLSEDGCLTIFCTARDTAPSIIRRKNAVEAACQTSLQESVEILQKNFEDLFLNRHEGDTIFKVKDQEFQAHRLILSTHSPVFYSMFNLDTEEKRTGIVNIQDCEPDTFKQFLRFLYTGKVDIAHTSNAVLLYKIADKYNVKHLMNECVRCMAEGLSVETFCDVILLGQMHSEATLLETSTKFFIDNVETILTNFKWQSLMSEHFSLANELFIHFVKEKLLLMRFFT